MSKLSYLYRGVHAQHPALSDARQGIVRPAQENSSLNAALHNQGGWSDISPFTSWTSDRALALRFARQHGPGGILLRVPQKSPGQGELWTWEWSPDRWMEDEMLMRGVRLNVEAFEV